MWVTSAVPRNEPSLRLRLAPEPQAGAEVEDDRVLAGHLEGDARGVAAVAAVRLARARRRAPDPVERDVQHLNPPVHVGGER